MPLISVCIAAERSEQYLKDAIESVLKQSFSDFEVLIVNDAGAQTSEYVQNIRLADARVRVIEVSSEDEPGSASHTLAKLNHALTESRGSLIQFLSAKDYLDPDCLQTFAQAFAVAPSLVLVNSAANLITADGVTISQPKVESSDSLISGRQVATSCLVDLGNSFEYVSTTCFRKDYAISGFDQRFFLLSYFEFFVRLAAQGDCLFLSRALCNVRKFEHLIEDGAVKESLVWLHDYALLHDLFQQFLLKEGVDFERENFDSAYWSSRGGISHLHMVNRIEEHCLRLKITAEDGLRAAREIKGFSSDVVFESYVRLAFEMAGHIHALTKWKNEALLASSRKAEAAGKEARAATQAECEIKFAKESQRMQMQIDELYAELTQLKEEHVKVLRSSSWLMTAPIRRFRASFLDGRSLTNKLTK